MKVSPKSYRFQQETIDKLEKVRKSIEEDLGTRITASAALEILINKYYKEHIDKE